MAIEVEHQNNFLLTNMNSELFLQRRKKIMIIDDDQDFRLALSEFLVNLGYSVTTAKDGEVALNNLIHQAECPDLILVDLHMPIKNGIEFRREQLKLRLNRVNEIPVIFITGFEKPEGEICLHKPLDETEFIEKLSSVVGN